MFFLALIAAGCLALVQIRAVVVQCSCKEAICTATLCFSCRTGFEAEHCGGRERTDKVWVWGYLGLVFLHGCLGALLHFSALFSICMQRGALLSDPAHLSSFVAGFLGVYFISLYSICTLASLPLTAQARCLSQLCRSHRALGSTREKLDAGSLQMLPCL